MTDAGSNDETGPGGACRRLDAAALRAWPLPPLDGDGDKESRGRVVIVAGSREIPGAAMLAARAALRAGAGKVMVATAASASTALALAVPELRVVGLLETPSGGLDPSCGERLAALADRAGAVLIGPGMQDEAATCALAQLLLERLQGVPIILDAAAMGAVRHGPGLRAPVMITPHAGEMAHLTGRAKERVLAGPLASAVAAAAQWNAVVVLKGATTVIAGGDGPHCRHDGGNVGLATAGSGDVLAGLIAGFLARGGTLEQAAAWGVVLHALAGERLADRQGGVGYLASELAAELPALMALVGADGPSPADAAGA
jgi:ADP-dependent NAD(P)H-hydrate dehydratase